VNRIRKNSVVCVRLNAQTCDYKLKNMLWSFYSDPQEKLLFPSRQFVLASVPCTRPWDGMGCGFVDRARVLIRGVPWFDCGTAFPLGYFNLSLNPYRNNLL